MTTMGKIRIQVQAQPAGEPFTAASLLYLGPRAAVDQSLTRLTKELKLLRVARGIYVRPKMNRFVGTVIPKVSEVLKALAEGKGETIHVHGAEAALRLGLTTQVPMKAIYYTDGPTRSLRIGQQEVFLKHASQRLLTLCGSPAGLAFSALWFMGKGQVTPTTIAVIEAKLAPEAFSILRLSPVLPAWLKEIFHRYEMGAANA